MLKLMFRLGERRDERHRGEPQWQARVFRDGITTIYVVEDGSAKPSADEDTVWLCEEGSSRFQSGDGRFRIVNVTLADVLVEGEIKANFALEKVKPDGFTLENRWQARLTVGENEIILVPDRKCQPPTKTSTWRVKPTRILWSGDGPTVVAVELVEEVVPTPTARCIRRRERKTQQPVAVAEAVPA